MSEFAKEVLPINIEAELTSSYLDYAMSVIVGRALPDVRDGLKPVHRRTLFAMNVLGNDWNKAYKKSARIVGDVIGKYHPHGDVAVYDTIVRMAQPFSLRYLLVDGQGNFGSVDGDSPAAMRYTEVRMSRLAHELLADLDKETVDYVPNYDGTEQIPAVLPTRIPNLLVNGSAGIAVGMATNIPPHNLTEVINGCLALIADRDIDLPGLMQHITGPDFPTAGFIYGREGIEEAYRTGRGRIFMRARYQVELDERSGKESLIVTEIPYQINKARLIEKIADLVKEKRLEGITALRDESNKEGMRIVIELRRGESSEVMMNNLYSLTPLQTSFGFNMVALADGQPKTFNLKEILDAFIRHRQEVVTRRTLFELRKARERAHVLEGLAIALANIDPIIELIRASTNAAEAKVALLARAWPLGLVASMLERATGEIRPDDLDSQYGLLSDGYHLSAAQAQAILDLRLHRLTGLEHEKILQEYRDLIEAINGLLAILGSVDLLMQVIQDELIAIRDQYGDSRRTEIVAGGSDITLADLIEDEPVVVTLSHEGYAKIQPIKDYEAQRRGGKGKQATRMKDEDFIERLLIANTHDTLLCFSSLGKVYWIKVYELPMASRTARGRPIVNLLQLDAHERINAILPVREYHAHHYVFMATSMGVVKKTPLTDFSRPRSMGIIAVGLQDGDCLIGAQLTDGCQEVMLFSDDGKVIRFPEPEVRAMGRTAAGVMGIRLKQENRVIALVVAPKQGQILTATENGFGKRSDIGDYPAHHRGGQGVVSIQVSPRNGKVVGAVAVVESDELMLISDGGTLVRIPVSEVRVAGRNTQGVTLIRLTNDEKLVSLARIEELAFEEAIDADFDADDPSPVADLPDA